MKQFTLECSAKVKVAVDFERNSDAYTCFLLPLNQMRDWCDDEISVELLEQTFQPLVEAKKCSTIVDRGLSPFLRTATSSADEGL